MLIEPAAMGFEGKKRPEQPDMEMLEFLGTFETAGRKEIDPLLLEEELPKLGKMTDKWSPAGPAAKKNERKNNKDGNDE